MNIIIAIARGLILLFLLLIGTVIVLTPLIIGINGNWFWCWSYLPLVLFIAWLVGE